MSYGEPEDEPGECNARLYVADNYGDNHATMRCQREPGHKGLHEERFKGRDVVVTWAEDERQNYGLCTKYLSTVTFTPEAIKEFCSDDE